jgi:hypothetical protein
MNNEDRGRAFITVAKWIEEAIDMKAAHDWAWTCTPYPCGLPSDDMLDEGLNVAIGALDLSTFKSRVSREMDQAMREYKTQQVEVA